MTETLAGFHISSGGWCWSCGHDRLVLVVQTGTCLTCAIDELDAGGVARQMPRMQIRRTVRMPVGAPPQPPRRRAYQG